MHTYSNLSTIIFSILVCWKKTNFSSSQKKKKDLGTFGRPALRPRSRLLLCSLSTLPPLLSFSRAPLRSTLISSRTLCHCSFHSPRLPGSSGSRPRRLNLHISLYPTGSFPLSTGFVFFSTASGFDTLPSSLFFICSGFRFPGFPPIARGPHLCYRLHQTTSIPIFISSSRFHIHSSIPFVSPFQGPLPGDPPNLLEQFAPLPPLPLSLPSLFHSFIPVPSSITIQMYLPSTLVGNPIHAPLPIRSSSIFSLAYEFESCTGLLPHQSIRIQPLSSWTRNLAARSQIRHTTSSAKHLHSPRITT